MVQVPASRESCDVYLPSDNHPYWFAQVGEGYFGSFTVPPDRHMNGLVLSVVYLSTLEIVTVECIRRVLIVNYTKCTLHIHKHGTVISFNDIDWHGIMSNFVTFYHRSEVQNTIHYLICDESDYLRKELESKMNSLRFIMKIVMCDLW